MKRSEAISILIFWILVAGVIAIRVTVGPLEFHRAGAGAAVAHPLAGKQSARAYEAMGPGVAFSHVVR